MEPKKFYTVCAWARTKYGNDWVWAADFDDPGTARLFARLLTKGTARAARIVDGWSGNPITQYDAAGQEMTAAEIAEWDEPEEELTEAEERERREEFIADQEYNIRREQQ